MSDNMPTWTETLSQHAAGATVDDPAALCIGLGVTASDGDDLLFIAARLAALVEGGVDWTWAVLQLRDAMGDDEGRDSVAFVATWLGRYADLAALMIRRGLLPKLEPIVPPDMTAEEIEAAIRGGGRTDAPDAPGGDAAAWSD